MSAEPAPGEEDTSGEETSVGVDVTDLDGQLEHNLASLFLKMQTILNISESQKVCFLVWLCFVGCLLG